MYLRKLGIIYEAMETETTFEKVAEGLLMVSVDNQIEGNAVPSYWRLTATDGMPPLEIGVDCTKRCISNIVFFVNKIRSNKPNNTVWKTEKGAPLLDTSLFRCVNDFVDVAQGYTVYLWKKTLMCLFCEPASIVYAFKNGRLEIYTDDENQVVGFSVCDLLDSEVSEIRTGTVNVSHGTLFCRCAFCLQAKQERGGR